MKYVYAPDWSVHLNKVSSNSSQNTVPLSRLGSAWACLFRVLRIAGQLMSEVAIYEPELLPLLFHRAASARTSGQGRLHQSRVRPLGG